MVAGALDVVAVLIFVAIGRASHDHGETLAGVASTAWPFLAGLGVGWVSARAWLRPLPLAPTGLIIWITEYYTGTDYRPVKSIAAASVTTIRSGRCFATAWTSWPVKLV